MAKVKRILQSYTIQGTNTVVKVGDSVLMRAPGNAHESYVARLEKIEADGKDNVKVRVRWFYRPEETIGGRLKFHGSKELFLSDHYDTQSAYTIEGLCKVHTFREYTKLYSVGNENYYCRFEYSPATGTFKPDKVAVYCICEMPYNPDDLMVLCEVCKGWYHPSCLKMTHEYVRKLPHFQCPECQQEETQEVEIVPKRQRL